MNDEALYVIAIMSNMALGSKKTAWVGENLATVEYMETAKRYTLDEASQVVKTLEVAPGYFTLIELDPRAAEKV